MRKLTADEAYDWLMQASSDSVKEDLDKHVGAAILAIALSEVEDGKRTICDGTGLDPDALKSLVQDFFPHAAEEFHEFLPDAYAGGREDEQAVRDILWMYAGTGTAFEKQLTMMIARRCVSPHHLWQDLGLHHRSELTELMSRHFPGLAQRNQQDMKWKKFLYRMVCRSEGFSLCSAPVCSECDDFANCFGSEDGESLLARSRAGQVVDI